MTIQPLADPNYLNLLNMLMAIRTSSGFFSFPAWGISHFFTNTQITTYTTERMEEKRTNTDLGKFQAQEGRSLWHFCVAICASVDYCKCVFERNSNSHQERWLIFSHWPTRPLSPQALAPALFLWLLLTAISCWLRSSLLLTVFICSTLVPCLPSSSSDFVGNLARTP